MTERFDVVVVGPGFGASAAACRLAQSGRSTLVLERGRRYPPGSFPRSPRRMSENVWDPSSGLYGMFDIWAFRRMEAVVSSGLGGGSLIYANVLLRKDPAWFVDRLPGEPPRPWPVTYQQLEPYYEAAEAMLGAQRYPFEQAPYAATPKTAAMRQAAHDLGLEWMLPPLAVTFANPGEAPRPAAAIREDRPNLHGLPRRTCRLCGECDVGCNDGAKNTLDYNYLSRAVDAGAEIRTLSEVRRIEPAEGGYRVTYRHYLGGEGDQADAAVKPVHRTVWGERLVLGAGTFGTTFLLLRNRAALPKVGAALGTRFSGNGDLLTFFHHGIRRSARSPAGRRLDPEMGPVITSAIRVPDELDGGTGPGFYIEDGGNPGFLDWVAQTSDIPGLLGGVTRFVAHRLWSHATGRPRAQLSGDITRLLGGGAMSAGLLPVLCMGRDTPDGVMSLKHGDLQLEWTSNASEALFGRMERTLRDISAALGVSLANTPLWAFKHFITVHPLGGAPMAATPADGVVDEWGEAFGYPGLHVVDGSVMPGPVGPNPSLTIAAFAERAASHIVGNTEP